MCNFRLCFILIKQSRNIFEMIAVFSGSVDGASATIIVGTVFQVAEYASCRWIIRPGRGDLARITACWVIISAVVDLTRLGLVVLPPDWVGSKIFVQIHRGGICRQSGIIAEVDDAGKWLMMSRSRRKGENCSTEVRPCVGLLCRFCDYSPKTILSLGG